MTTPVSIIITAHNYAKYLPRALESALAQNYEALEVVAVDDGSADHTPEVLETYRGRPNLKIVTTEGLGLAAACNRGIAASTGAYIVRLDADDWFDENLALVLATYLDRHSNVGLVFCDYHTVNVHGDLIEQVRRAKVNDEVELLDRPALAAGAMYRRKCYDAIGGYDESLRYQEDYDFWLKFIERYQVRNVSLPLMYCRRHASSMSRNREARMAARHLVKQRFVAENRDHLERCVLAVVPARADKLDGTKLPLIEFGGETLLHHCIAKLAGIDLIDRIVVSTDDPAVAEAAISAGAEVPVLRPMHSAMGLFENALLDLLHRLQVDEGYELDIVAIVHPHSPFLRREQIIEAVDTMLIYDTDSVIAVVEDLTYHWQVGRNGLTPVGYQKRVLRQEKDLIYKEAGSLYVIKAPKFIATGDLLGRVIGHIEVQPYDAVRVQTAYDRWVAERMTEGWRPA